MQTVGIFHVGGSDKEILLDTDNSNHLWWIKDRGIVSKMSRESRIELFSNSWSGIEVHQKCNKITYINHIYDGVYFVMWANTYEELFNYIDWALMFEEDEIEYLDAVDKLDAQWLKEHQNDTK